MRTLINHHGTSRLLLDRAVPNVVEIFRLLLSSVSSTYETILLVQTGVGKIGYKRFSVVNALTRF